MSTSDRLRIATYNLRDLHDDRAGVIRVIRAIDPDVLCLQEVPRQLLGVWRVSGLAADARLLWSGNHRGSGGTTILTSLRVDTAWVHHHALATALRQRTRGFAVARVRSGPFDVRVGAVHLGLDPAERERHVGEVLAELAASGADSPVIVAGDFNESAGGPAWDRVARDFDVISSTAPTFPVGAPDARIDAIFASRGWDYRVKPGDVADLPASVREDILRASDHRPVWVDLHAPA